MNPIPSRWGWRRNELGRVQWDLRELLPAARTQLEHALQISEAALGADHPQSAAIRHEPLIDPELFQRVQNIQDKIKKRLQKVYGNEHRTASRWTARPSISATSSPPPSRAGV